MIKNGYGFAFRWLLILWSLAVGVSASEGENSVAVADGQITPISSPNDTRHYQYTTLSNGLQVLLISDPETDKSAAAMDVHVGNSSDPEDRGGLAHFLEHMLFLGTDRYPLPDEYQQFIAAHGGGHNAFTSSEHTNYFFDVDADHIDEALDRFARFFVAPLFNPQYVERERNAVHSEFRARYRNDYRRRMDVIGDIVNPLHPYAKFGVGNLETLADQEGRSVRDDLLAFYQAHYSADNMTLVVLGKEGLDELSEKVAERFSAIPKRSVSTPESGIALMPPDLLPALVEIQPVQTLRRLTLSFPVPMGQHYREKPMQYLGGLLGHEGEGSLLSFLKAQGWAEGLSAGGHAKGRNQQTFDVTITLTEDGVAHREQVAAAVFSMAQKIRKKGIKRWRFEEQQALSEIAFRFVEKGEPIHTVSQLANAMHDYPAEDILRGPYALDHYDAKLIRRYAAALTPDNALQVLEAPDVVTDTISHRYEVPYRVVKLDKVDASLPRKQLKALVLPRKNPFIPSDLDIESPSAVGKPSLLSGDNDVRLWFGQSEFQVPKGQVRVRVLSPQTGSSLQGSALTQLYVELVNDKLNEFSYPALLAGLSFSLNAHSRGLDLSLAGYDDKQGILLQQVVQALSAPQFDQRRFDSLKAELIRRWRNDVKLTPYKQLYRKLPLLLYSPLWDRQAMADALSEVTIEQLSQFVKTFYDNSDVDVLVYGNYKEEQAEEFGALLRRNLNATGADDQTVSASKVAVLEGERAYHLPVDHRDKAIILYLQAPSDSLQDRAAMLMLRQLLSADFFHVLRTEKQLGYIVFMSDMALKDVAGHVFVVQSPSATVEQLRAEIADFAEQYVGVVTDFEQHKAALLSKLTESPKNLGEEVADYWGDIVAPVTDFDRRADLVRAVEALTPERMAAFSQQVMGLRDALWLTAGEGAQPDQSVDLGSERFRFQDIWSDAKVREYR